jgi:hypothetical protein
LPRTPTRTWSWSATSTTFRARRPWRKSPGGAGGGGASGFVNTGARLPESAVTYLGRTSRIDHIVVSSPAVSQEEWTGQVAIYPKPRGAARRAYEASVSDHLPSWATFKVDRDNDP